jgi:hypothetical protein
MMSAFKSMNFLWEWHREQADGGDQQQDQDDETQGLSISGPGVLQAEDPSDARDEVRSNEIN